MTRASAPLVDADGNEGRECPTCGNWELRGTTSYVFTLDGGDALDAARRLLIGQDATGPLLAYLYAAEGADALDAARALVALAAAGDEVLGGWTEPGLSLIAHARLLLLREERARIRRRAAADAAADAL